MFVGVFLGESSRSSVTSVIDRTVGEMRPHVCYPKTNVVRHAVGMEAAPQLFTIGYEGRSIGEFVDVLVEAGVDVLVDVRERALSRKKGFSKRALGEALGEAGISYVHEPSLGNPKDNREAFRAGEPAAWARYLAHLNNGSRAAFEATIELSTQRSVALMCFERDHDTCHRSCVTDTAVGEQPDLSVVLL